MLMLSPLWLPTPLLADAPLPDRIPARAALLSCRVDLLARLAGAPLLPAGVGPLARASAGADLLSVGAVLSPFHKPPFSMLPTGSSADRKVCTLGQSL